MTDLNALYNYLTGKGATLSLDATDANLQAELQGFIGNMPGKKITLAPGAQGISLQNNLLTLSGATADVWPVQGLTNVSATLSAALITISTASGKTVITGSTQGQLPFSPNVSVPVTLTARNQDGNPWQVTLPADAANVTPLDAILLGNTSGSLPFDLPSGMDFLSTALTVNKDAYSITFYPNSTKEAFTRFTLHASGAAWTPVPNIFAFNGLDIIGSIKTNSIAVTLLGHLLIDQTGVDVGITLSTGSNWLAFINPTPPATAFPGLAALANWIGGKVLGTELSTGFSSVQLNTSGFDLAIAGISASINYSKFSLNFLNISSLLTIGALKLDVVLQLPLLIITGGLHGAAGLPITNLLSSMGLPADAVPANLTLAKANFSANLRNSIYSIDTEVDNVWTAGPFNFESISLALGYNAVTGLTGSFGCKFQIGNAATILLVADYEGAESGWIFNGGLDPATTLNIGDVITMLLNNFGIPSVPQPVQSLTITNLYVTYTTAAGNFEFDCAGKFTVDDTQVDMTVVVKLQKAQPADPVQPGKIAGTKGYNAFFSGNITVNNLVFDIVFNTSDTATNVFVASYHNTKTGSIPLHDLVAGISTSMAALVPASLILDLKEVKFVFFEQNLIKQFAFGLALNVSIDFSQLPVVGNKLPSGTSLNIRELEVLFASVSFTNQQVGIINPLLPKGILPLNTAGLGKGLFISGNLVIAGYTLPLNTGNQPGAATTTVAPFTGKAATPVKATTGTGASPSPITWFNVNKQLGPVKFQRIGVEYENNVLSFALDASLTMGPATLAMQALSIGSSLSAFSPVFGLQGFAMDINTGGLEIGGAFLKAITPQGLTAYYGEVIVKIGTFSLKALGGESPAQDINDPNHTGQKLHIPASFFLYACINAPLGGPPFLYLNGFAGGFGVNNTLILPTLQDLPNYILLPGPGSKAPAQEASPADTITGVLPQLQKYFVTEPGEYWAAAGIAFSSFQMINAFALVTVSFGVDFQVALIGSCSMTFPTGAPEPVAYIEIDIMASFSPATGRLAVEGILSPASYVFGPFCQITGGFAFYIWFNPPATANGPKTGDFLVTIGGYHPAFTPPAYYPKVPRLGINFNLGPLHVTGGCYFALTPAMFMAGGALKATWEIEGMKAWFIMGMDILIVWAPFHYEADAYITIGCSVNIGLVTVNVSVGAYLTLWGPSFGGKAVVDLDVVSFTISFGAAQAQPAPIGWSDFKSKFLPADNGGKSQVPAMMMAMAVTRAAAPENTDGNTTNIVKSTIPSGLNGSGTSGVDWILDSDHFIILVNSTVPVNTPQWATGAGSSKPVSTNMADYNASPPPVDPQKWPYLVFTGETKYSDTAVWNPVVNIKPMNLNNVTSSLSISLMKMNDSTGDYDNYVTAVSLEPVILDSSAALWASASGAKPAANDPSFQSACLTGFSISPLPRVPNLVNGVLLIQLLYQQGNQYFFTYRQQVINTAYTVGSITSGEDDSSTLTITVSGTNAPVLAPSTGYVLKTLNDSWVADKRNAILANLNQIGFRTYATASLDTFTTQTALTDWPGVMLLSGYLQDN